MSGFNQLDLIWLSELNMAVLYPVGELETSFAGAAIIVKGEDGTDLFIPYEGYVVGAPIAFSLGPLLNEGLFSLVVLGFGANGEPNELASFQLDEGLVPHVVALEGDVSALEMHVVGFGERHYGVLGDGASGQQAGDHQTGDHQTGGRGVREIGLRASDYEISGAVDYSDLLATFLYEMRSLEDDHFTGFFITGVPRREQRVGPCVHLRPLHHYQLGFTARAMKMALEDDDLEAFDLHEEEEQRRAEGAAILSRHDGFGADGSAGSFRVRSVPEFTLHAGMARESVDFVLRNGFQIHWRRQLESWGGDRFDGSQGWQADEEPSCFVMDDMVERDCLVQHDGAYYFRWTIEDAVIGDVVGLVFALEHASVDMAVALPGMDEVPLEQTALFIFMGDEFVPLTDEILNAAENLGITARLQSHIDKGLKQKGAKNHLRKDRVALANRLFERDDLLRGALGMKKLNALADSAPFGPELMVYRDHILRVSQNSKGQAWVDQLFGSASPSMQRGRLSDVMQFETFKKAPAFAHALVFNEAFATSFHNKPVDPPSFRMSVLEYLLGKLFSESLIDWAMRLKGESQAIIWHLALKRPAMVERLYELKLEPDVALNPFDDKTLDHAQAALDDSSHIDVNVIEKKVIPVLKALGDDRQIETLSDFAKGLHFGAEGKKLNIGELSVCLGAVERVQLQWQNWVEQAELLFKPLLHPLTLTLISFEEGEDFSSSLELETIRRDIDHLIERLVDETKCQPAIGEQAIAFIKSIETDVFLKELHDKLDLALKYHHDLMVGVEQIYEQFETNDEALAGICAIKDEEWPTLDDFGPTFGEPFVHEQLALNSQFEKSVERFSQNVHPHDDLFHQTLREALSALEAALPKLVWLKAGLLLNQRVEKTQVDLEKALFEIKPLSAKLRRSKSVSNAVRQLVMAERMGPSGWPIIHQSLEIIEKNLSLPKS